MEILSAGDGSVTMSPTDEVDGVVINDSIVTTLDEFVTVFEAETGIDAGDFTRRRVDPDSAVSSRKWVFGLFNSEPAENEWTGPYQSWLNEAIGGPEYRREQIEQAFDTVIDDSRFDGVKRATGRSTAEYGPFTLRVEPFNYGLYHEDFVDEPIVGATTSGGHFGAGHARKTVDRGLVDLYKRGYADDYVMADLPDL